MTSISPRSAPSSAVQRLVDHGLPPALARIFAARGIEGGDELDTSFASLLPFDTMKGAHDMARQLADAIEAGHKILVIADYDADGATACAVAVRGLGMMGARIDFLVPNRFEYGYGLTPEIVHLAADAKPDILLTVDNGIASVAGVAEANRLGMKVLVTDHHLPGDELPDAACIVNPNQPGCAFPSKNLAGVGVMFYVLLALRAELRQRGFFNDRAELRERGAFDKSPPPPLLQRGENVAQPDLSPPLQKGGQGGLPGRLKEPNLANLLDLVALGTIADVVKLDQNNRILVQQGLQRIRAGRACPGIVALLRIAKRDPARVTSLDLGFAVGPRLNAAGRLDDMSLGIDCLLTDDEAEAERIAKELETLNRERRNIEADMQDSALASLETVDPSEDYTLSLFDADWHQGVIGILASRLKDRYHRPTIAFARANDGEIKGSGRSIPGLHLRDALDLVSKRHPALIRKFGGHAAAAGLSIAEADFEAFVAAFEQVASELLDEADLVRRIETDGALAPADMTLALAQSLNEQVWGQGFPAPQFDDEFLVRNQRVVGEKHLKLWLESGGRQLDAIFFNQADPLPNRVRLVYSLDINEYNGSRSLQLVVRHWQ